MNLLVILSDSARAEFNDAIDWYDEHDLGRGDLFDQAVHHTMKRIGEQPLLHPMIFEDVRAKRVPGFPYRMFFAVGPSHVSVLAVFHDSRDPKEWQSGR